MRRIWFLAVAVVATVLTATPASAANNVLTRGSAAGTAVAVNDTLTASLATGTTANFFSSASNNTGVKCAVSTFTAKVLSNPAAPATATESLTGQTFTSCTANVAGVTSVSSVVVNNLPYATSVNSTTKAVTVSGTAALPIQTTVKLNTILGQITCVYRRTATVSITGTASNTDNSIQFSNQQFAKFSGPSLCFASAFFTARYAPVLDAGQGVFVN
jgi:hypothetical protein